MVGQCTICSLFPINYRKDDIMYQIFMHSTYNVLNSFFSSRSLSSHSVSYFDSTRTLSWSCPGKPVHVHNCAQDVVKSKIRIQYHPIISTAEYKSGSKPEEGRTRRTD